MVLVQEASDEKHAGTAEGRGWVVLVEELGATWISGVSVG